MAGPVYEGPCARHVPRTAGDGCRDLGRSNDPAERVAIPVATFKVVLILEPGETLADLTERDVLAVIMPNDGDIRAVPWTDYITSAAVVEQRTGYRLFDQLPAALRERLLPARFSLASEDAARIDEDPGLFVGCGFSDAPCEEGYDCCSDLCIAEVCR